MKENSIIYKFVEIQDVSNELCAKNSINLLNEKFWSFFAGLCLERNLKNCLQNRFQKTWIRNFLKNFDGKYDEISFWIGELYFFPKEKFLPEEKFTMVKNIRNFLNDFCNVFHVEVISNSNKILNWF